MVMQNSRQASTGRATRNTTASSLLMEKATPVAATSITGPLQKGRMPVETVFWILVTSLVSLVTREDTRKWSMLEKEYFCSFSYSARRSSAPSPCPARAANLALPTPRIKAIRPQITI